MSAKWQLCILQAVCISAAAAGQNSISSVTQRMQDARSLSCWSSCAPPQHTRTLYTVCDKPNHALHLLTCLQELRDVQLTAAAAAVVTADSAAAAAAAGNDGQPSAPLIDLAGETTTEVPAGLLTDDQIPIS
jgi:hypothetical protein